MNYRELKSLNKSVLKKREQLEAAKSRAYRTAARLGSGAKENKPYDRVGNSAADIVDLTAELKQLETELMQALDSLSAEEYEANCIRLRIVAGYSWAKIAAIIGTGKDALRRACERYKW